MRYTGGRVEHSVDIADRRSRDQSSFTNPWHAHLTTTITRRCLLSFMVMLLGVMPSWQLWRVFVQRRDMMAARCMPIGGEPMLCLPCAFRRPVLPWLAE